MADDTVTQVVLLPEDLHALVKARAAEDERTIAATIRLALRRYLATPEPG